MNNAAQTELVPALAVAQAAHLRPAANGLRYANYGDTQVSPEALLQIIEAVPPALASALARRAYYFVPLTLGEMDKTEIAPAYTADLGDRATCHRNVGLRVAPAESNGTHADALADTIESTFISTRLMQDRFALAFEFFINIGHQYVETSGVPEPFTELAWTQARADVRGETSQDAYEARKQAVELLRKRSTTTAIAVAPAISLPAISSATSDVAPAATSEDPAKATPTREEDRARLTFFEAAFADALAIYMLSLSMDIDYADLREREYPLLAAPALADRLRLVNQLFPAASGYEFAIRYRRRHM